MGLISSSIPTKLMLLRYKKDNAKRSPYSMLNVGRSMFDVHSVFSKLLSLRYKAELDSVFYYSYETYALEV